MREPGLNPTLKVTEIFHSTAGETRFIGLPAVFIRLCGCPLRCRWCDTAYAYTEGEERTVGEVIAQVEGFGVGRVVVTGGEPLMQPACHDLLGALCNKGMQVLLETSGALSVQAVDPRVHIIMDYKPPSSGMTDRMLAGNLDLLREKDELKLVVADEADYEFMRALLARARGRLKAPVVMQPAFGSIEPRTLVEWILRDRLDVRFLLQLHKIIWPPETQGV